jgi:hypothetical protein
MEMMTSNLEGVLVYIDDVTVYNGAEVAQGDECALWMDHLEKLRAFLDRCAETHLTLNMEKCRIGERVTKFLGHILTAEGLQPNPAKVEAVNSFEVPKDLKSVQAFVGLVGYYRNFIPLCSEICRPLSYLTKKGVEFIWTADCQEAFDLLKYHLTHACVRAYPDPTKAVILCTDASDYALGAVLSQENDDGVERVISYYSRSFSTAELNYSVHEKEALAMVAAFKHFHIYITNLPFLVYTDHRSLATLLSWKEPSRRIARWIMKLQEYSFTAVYRKGSSNNNADALSRLESRYVHLPNPEVGRVVCLNMQLTAEGIYEENDPPMPSINHVFPGTSTAVSISSVSIQKWAVFSLRKKSKGGRKPRAVIESTTREEFEGIEPVKDREQLQKYLMLIGRHFVDDSDLEEYVVTDVRFDEQRSEILGTARKVSAPEEENDLDAVWNVEYLWRAVHSKLSEHLPKEADPMWELQNGQFQEEVRREISDLLDNGKLRRDEIVMLEDCRGYEHAYRRAWHQPSKSVHFQLIVPMSEEKLRQLLMESAHEGHGHGGVNKTQEVLLMSVWWCSLRSDVREFVRRCSECQRRNSGSRVQQEVQVFPEVLGPGRAWSIDFVVDLPVTGANNKNMIVAIDRFSKYCVIQAVEDKKASTTANFILTRLCYAFGFPEYVLSDQGKEFVNSLNSWIFSISRTYKARTTAYHPACNGQVERFNRTIKNSLAKLCDVADHRDWDRVVDAVAFGLNTSIHSVTSMTPFFLHFGREARGDLAHLLPDAMSALKDLRPSVRDEVQQYVEEIRMAQRIAQDNMDRVHAIYNKPRAVVSAHRHASRLPAEYKVGDYVLVFTPRIEGRLLGDDARPIASRSLGKNWRGPFVIVEAMDNGVNYKIARLDGTRPYIIHANRLKEFIPNQYFRPDRVQGDHAEDIEEI